MNGFWGWVGAIAAGWFTASILLGIAWATVGRRIFRKPPQPPTGRSNVRRIDGEEGDSRFTGGAW